MKGDDALRIVGMVGEHLIRQPTARRDLTALVIVIADLTDWDTASDYAGALGLEGDQLEAVHTSWQKGRSA